MNDVKRKKGIYCLCVCWSREGGGGGERERDREREREGNREGEGVCEWACLHPGRLVCGGLGWFGGGLGWFGGGLGLTWQVYVIYVIQMLLNSFFKSSYYHKNIFWGLRKWFGVV